MAGRTTVSFSPATSRVGEGALTSARETPDVKPSTNARRNARGDEARSSALPASSIPMMPLNKAVTGRVWRKGDTTVTPERISRPAHQSGRRPRR